MARSVTLITLEEARRVIDAGLATAETLNVPVFVTVVNAFGQTVAAARADGSNFFSQRIAEGKALTAIGMGAPTQLWEEYSHENPDFAGGITSVADFVPFAGGIPLTMNGELIGSVGVSGGTTPQDIEIATAAAAAL